MELVSVPLWLHRGNLKMYACQAVSTRLQCTGSSSVCYVVPMRLPLEVLCHAHVVTMKRYSQWEV